MSRRVVHGHLVVAAALAATAMMTSACTSAVDGSEGAEDPPVGLPDARPADVGDSLVSDGIEIEVRSIEAYDRSDSAFPRLRLVVRSSNASDHDATNPEVGLICDESPDPGEWHLGSTWEPAGFLPEGSVSEGELLVAFPSKTGDRFYPLAACTSARIRIVMGGSATADLEVAEIPVDPALIDEALVRPLGPRFPLPTIVG